MQLEDSPAGFKAPKACFLISQGFMLEIRTWISFSPPTRCSLSSPLTPRSWLHSQLIKHSSALTSAQDPIPPISLQGQRVPTLGEIPPMALGAPPVSPAGIVHFHSKLLLTEIEVFQLFPLE